MKIFLLPYYFTRSILLRGLFNSIRLLRGELKNEKYFGIETMAIKKSDSKEYFHYQGAGYIVLFRIFEAIKQYTKFTFTDIGCGKGRVVFVAESRGFSKLRGIDLDQELIDQARKNCSLFAFKRPESEITFMQINALEYKYTDEPSVYFFFNPFNEAVMEKVLQKICSEVRSECIFVYMNPLYQKPFVKRNLEVLEKIKTRWYLEAVIYKKNKENNLT